MTLFVRSLKISRKSGVAGRYRPLAYTAVYIRFEGWQHVHKG